MPALPFARLFAVSGAFALATVLAAPAAAHDVMPMPGVAPETVDTRPAWKPEAVPHQMPHHGMAHHGGHGGGMQAIDPQAREDWLAECRRRVARRDSGLGGAAVGGLLGGLLGNRVAGRHHRTTGTVVGAVAGAAAGMAIDKAEDRGRDRDYCEAYLDDYYARYSQPAYAGHGQTYTWGYAVPMMMVPVARPQRPVCKETVITEEIEEPVARRHVHRPRRHIVRDKRVRIAPDKRLRAD